MNILARGHWRCLAVPFSIYEAHIWLKKHFPTVVRYFPPPCRWNTLPCPFRLDFSYGVPSVLHPFYRPGHFEHTQLVLHDPGFLSFFFPSWDSVWTWLLSRAVSHGMVNWKVLCFVPFSSVVVSHVPVLCHAEDAPTRNRYMLWRLKPAVEHLSLTVSVMTTARMGSAVQAQRKSTLADGLASPGKLSGSVNPKGR